jgi:hypothetical protein
MKRMTKSRGDDLCKGGTQSAGLICGPIRLYSQIDVVGTGDMTEFMNHSTLLCHHQQQQQGQGFERLSHSNGYQPLSLIGFSNANRMLSNLQHPRVMSISSLLALD